MQEAIYKKITGKWVQAILDLTRPDHTELTVLLQIAQLSFYCGSNLNKSIGKYAH